MGPWPAPHPTSAPPPRCSSRCGPTGPSRTLIARRQLSLDLTVEDTTKPSRKSGREVDLHVHLSHAAITGAGGIGHLDNLNRPVLEQQVRTWCGTAGSITVKPVIDLARCAPVDRYDIPESMGDLVDLRDRHCAFPRCTRPARKCDTDHVLPHATDGITRPCNLAALCRRHHRLKTHGHWRYLTLKPGMYLWTSPYGYQYLVDHDGTTDVSTDRRSRHRRNAHYSTDEPER